MTSVSRIKLTKGKVALVDASDTDRISIHRWYALHRDGNWHAARTEKRDGKKRTVYMHHEVLRSEPGEMVDHVNMNGLDNRRHNLRLCTKAQNARNSFRRIHGKTSRFKGVCKKTSVGACKSRPWVAYIVKDGKQRFLGNHATQKSAALAYDAAAVEMFGEFAATNF